MSATIAYLTGDFPAATQTFIYREVRELRKRGWTVQAVTLNNPEARDRPAYADLEDGLIGVYGDELTATLGAAMIELAAHPLRACRTMLAAFADAIAPGEPTATRVRLRTMPQALAGIGLARRLRRRDVRHIHCHFAHSPTSVGMYAARQMNIFFSFTGHANDIFQRRALLRRKLERAAFVSCVSHWHEEFFRKAAPGADTSYRLIRYGVDLGAWAMPASASLQSQPLEGGAIRVLTCCRLVEKKGIDILLRSLAELDRIHHRHWNLTVAGDGPERKVLESLTRQLAIDSRVRWLGGVPNDRVPQLISEADVFVLPCRDDSNGDRDGIPVALIESMARGTPVISGDLPAIRELIDDGTNGILICAPGSPEGISRIAESILHLCDNPAVRDRLTAAARKRVEEEFALHECINRIEKALRDTIVPDARPDAIADPLHCPPAL